MSALDAIATPLPLPDGGQENVSESLVRMLQEHRDVLGARWADMAVEFVRARSAFGRRKYGQELHTFDGRPPHIDALQELVDLMQYLHKGELEHARLLAENAGLRAKAAVLEDERDGLREKARLLEAALADANLALDRARAPAAPAPIAQTDATGCEPVPDEVCASRPACRMPGGAWCPAFPGVRWLGRIA